MAIDLDTKQDFLSMSKILVIGSSNTDLITTVEHLPAAGETVTGKVFFQANGGKGANQAMAAHRAGGDVKFVTCMGNDIYGQSTLAYYKSAGLDVSHAMLIDKVATGTAIILVNRDGENCIVVTPGANHSLSSTHIEKLEKEIADASIIALQMEIPYATVRKVCELAAKYNTRVLLNVAPAREIDLDILKMIDILVVNETEIETVSGHSIIAMGEEAIMDSLLLRGAKNIILTLGRRGCIVKNAKTTQVVPAFKVTAVDSTAAGDTFCGSLVARLSKGEDMMHAVQFATAAAAICVTRMGAQPSIPTEQEVTQFLESSHAVGTNGVPVKKKTII
jgi:ribokinase